MLSPIKKFGRELTSRFQHETISNQSEVQDWLRQHFLSEKIQVAKTNFAYEISAESTILEKLHKIIRTIDECNLMIAIDKQDRKFTKKDTQLAAATFLKPLDTFTRVLMTVDTVAQVYYFFEKKAKEYQSEEYQPYLQHIAESRQIPLESVILEVASDVDQQLTLQQNCTKHTDSKQVVIDEPKSRKDDVTENFESIDVQEVILGLKQQFPSAELRYSKTKLGYEISAEATVLEKLMEDLKKIDEYELSIVIDTVDRKFTHIDTMQADVLFLQPSGIFKKVLVTSIAFKYLHQLIKKNRLNENPLENKITETLESLTLIENNIASENQLEDKGTETLEPLTPTENIVNAEYPYGHPTNCLLQ